MEKTEDNIEEIMEETEENIYEIRNLGFSYDKTPVIKDLSLNIKRGNITTILGANGCGKTTLFGLLTKGLKPRTGQINFCNLPLNDIKNKDFAKEVAIVHQKNTPPPDMSVKKLISYGRTPYKSAGIKSLSRCSYRDDEDIINWAMEITNTTKHQEKGVLALSGGQMQRVWIAMALAQDTDILFLDEPTTFLDVRYQLEVLALIRHLNEKYGKTIVMVLHDINQALAYSHEIIALKEGQIVAQHSPEKIARADLLEEIYGVKMKVAAVDGSTFVLPI